jgi:Rieske Fe-S protein
MGDEKTAEAGRSRRAVLAGAGAVGAAVVLAACGGEETPAATTDPATSGPSAGTGGDGATGAPVAGGGSTEPVLVRTGDVPVGGGRIIGDKQVVVTQPVAGDFRAFSAVCTHQFCPVSQIGGGTIICTCHNSRFSIEDGSVRGGPATKPLPRQAIRREGENIYLD